MDQHGRKLPPLDRFRPADVWENTLGPSVNANEAGRLPALHAPGQLSPEKRASPVLGFDGGFSRAVGTAKKRLITHAEVPVPDKAGPPNFRAGLLEADFDGELVTGMDVIEYYSTYGHSANIKLFHLVTDNPDGHPYNLRVRALCATQHHPLCELASSALLYIRLVPTIHRSNSQQLFALARVMTLVFTYGLVHKRGMSHCRLFPGIQWHPTISLFLRQVWLKSHPSTRREIICIPLFQHSCPSAPGCMN